MHFVKIVKNIFMYEFNNLKIDNAVKLKKITEIQAIFLRSNNNKCRDICKHKGLLEIQDGKIYFYPRTSWDRQIKLPKTVDELKSLKGKSEYFQAKKLEFIKFNELCNIGDRKWILGAQENNIEVQDFEERLDVIAKLVGTKEDLQKFKEWVKYQDLEEFDISPYFNIDQIIDGLEGFNSKNTIKDE